MAPVIKVQGLGKRYTLGGSADVNQSFREMLVQSFTAPVRRLLELTDGSSGTSSSNEEFWALKDVNFEVQQGEVVGVIGRNGAGKSTLLKILSRITEPTEGRVEIRGRVASLLEVGTGFHPELTGHENIYLNGAILGMSSNEISRKFDEIVAFAEVEKFINTPVKHYSSGMYVRLAFAVAAHLEPEILLVDEVLAVGDTQFQEKCLGKMQEVGKEGRTVLFVSHNMGAVGQLCEASILLAGGHIALQGGASDVIQHYLFSGRENQGERIWEAGEMPGRESLGLRRLSILQSGRVSNAVNIEVDFVIEIETVAEQPIREAMIGLIVKDFRGIEVLHSSSVCGDFRHDRDPGTQVFRCTVPGGLLNVGQYSLTVGADIPNVKSFFLESDALTFSVEATSPKMNRYLAHTWKGVTSPLAVTWSLGD